MEMGLSLGSNTAQRLHNLSEARTHIADIPGITILDHSPVYETEPVDVPAEYRDMAFLNGVLIVASEETPHLLLPRFLKIEHDMGRHRTASQNAPRPIDIDIIYAGDLQCSGDDLVIPHPRWMTRRFVVEPLCSVRPSLCLPGQSITIEDLLLTLPPRPAIRFFSENWGTQA